MKGTAIQKSRTKQEMLKNLRMRQQLFESSRKSSGAKRKISHGWRTSKVKIFSRFKEEKNLLT